MDAADARLITDLAERISAAGPATKDPDAERLILEQIGRQPDSLYVLVQAVLLQEQALRVSQERIAELEREVAARAEPTPRRGFLDSLFGGPEPEAPAVRQAPAPPHAQQAAPAPGYPQPGPAPQGPALGAPGATGGGSFLRTAAAGALGVAGGVLLASSISNLFAGDGNQAEAGQGNPHGDAQQADAEQTAYDQGAADQAAQDQGGWDAGGWGDGGGWDV